MNQPRAFISYARADADRAAGIKKRLRQLGYAVWIEQVLKGGQTWWDEILSEIRQCDVLLAIVPAGTARRPVVLPRRPVDLASSPSPLAKAEQMDMLDDLYAATQRRIDRLRETSDDKPPSAVPRAERRVHRLLHRGEHEVGPGRRRGRTAGLRPGAGLRCLGGGRRHRGGRCVALLATEGVYFY